ncbi:hypothetical protein V493_07180 [Pseudogymnoascus sp. VKM F-4281 (FW-2241)]|nr:hypothetical protein V493_07180 [Pseudogymnoascus sp. VKM F-4281 (FW-2241)]
MTSNFYIGQRLSYYSVPCTVRYIGPVAGTKDDWLGVEWDYPSRGKHDGEHKGVKYFDTRRGSTNAGSFVRPSRAPDVAESFVEAVHRKYASEHIEEQDEQNELIKKKEIEISGKVVYEVGFDKIRKQMAQLDELKIVLVDGMRIVKAETEGKRIRDTCPMIAELDLSRNLFQSCGEIIQICAQLDHLRSLRLNGNRLAVLPQEFEGKESQDAFAGVTDLGLNEMILPWEKICLLSRQFKDVTSIEASSNDLLTLPLNGPSSLLPMTLTSITLEYNDFTSLSDLLPLTGLTSLKSLHLKGNQISTVGTGHEGEKPVFSDQLSYVDLSYNKVADWQFVDSLPDVFPSLTALRMSHNPVYEAVAKPGDVMTSADEGYMLTLGRLANLKSLNFSTITPAERTNAEIFYLSRIAKEMAAVPEGEERTVTEKHRRFSELCKIYEAPVVRRAEKDINPDLLEARLIKFTFCLPAGTLPSQTSEISKVQEIPRGFDVYRIKGIVGKLFDIRPLSLCLIWETGEWDPVAGYEDEEYDSEDLEEGGDSVTIDAESRAAKGKWMMREVELEDSTRQVGNSVDGMEAKRLRLFVHHFVATAVVSVVNLKLESLSFTSHTYPASYGRIILPTALHIVIVEVRNPETDIMPAQKIALSAGRPTQGHHELPRRSLRLHPEYYIKRDTGELVPLVPADELPSEFYGLPRSMSSAGSPGMIFLGQKGPWTGYYRMKQPKASILSEEPGVDNDPPNSTQGPKVSRELFADSIGRRLAPEPVAFNATASTSSEEATSPARSRSEMLLDSQLCYNWIRGHCKFGPNCHRLHQMPETTEEWQDIVLRGILNRGGNSKGVDNFQKFSRHNKPPSELDTLNREIVFLRRALANQSHMRNGKHQKAPRAGAREIEARLIQKVLGKKDVKRDLDREAELGREQGQKDSTEIGKERKEESGARTTSSQLLASKTEGVRTGHLVDVKDRDLARIDKITYSARTALRLITYYGRQRRKEPGGKEAFQLTKHDYKAFKLMFALYLDIQKGKILDDLDETEARGRWKSFIGKWNRCELSEGWYDPSTYQRAMASASELEHQSRDSEPPPRDPPKQRYQKHEPTRREDVESSSDDSVGPALPGQEGRQGKGRVGPSIPNMQDLELRRENESEEAYSRRKEQREDIKYARKLDRKGQKEALDELVPRAEAGTRERQLEKKREVNETMKSFREKSPGAAEVPESELMGGGDSLGEFKAKKQEFERKKNDREIRREEMLMARAAERDERLQEYREKEDKTMAMLRGLARQNFGA